MSLSTLRQYKSMLDPRGVLSVVDDREIPFKIKRVFWISNVPPRAARGQHAHRKCEQVIICLVGSFDVWNEGMKYELNDLTQTLLYVPSHTCLELKNFSRDAVALVLCSEYYDTGDVVKC
jgi:dTDP-4-dehydrorhamnose 3,5-epimerase-like enzyme